MIINHNLTAMNAERQFNITVDFRKKTTEKLSSGFRVNRAADDAAGLAISEKMRRQIRGLARGAENIQEGISLIQTADGALAEVHDILNRMEELSVEAANGVYSDSDREYLQMEMGELTDEIDRIGKTTEFNDLLLFDDMYGEEVDGSVTNLVISPAADTGFLTEALQLNGAYYPSASLDFSNINSRNINKLNDQGFSFTCSQSCAEVFDIKFATDGRPSTALNLSGKVTHRYLIDISGCTSGKDVVDTVYSYIRNHVPNGYGIGGQTPDSLKVSHSNELIKSNDGNKLIIYANGAVASKTDAETKYLKGDHVHGAIDCSQLTGLVEDEKINEIPIQCSSNVGDREIIYTHRMNASLIGVSAINISTIGGAQSAMSIIKNAHAVISSQRSELGAFQNRLEHSYNNNKNIEENTQAAESSIRDADMATQMVEFSKQNILLQTGQAMLAQANQSKQDVLRLLQEE